MTTLKPHISLFDKSYAENKAKGYQLYIELSTNGLKQTIFNVENSTFIGFEEYRFSDVYNDYSLVAPLKEISFFIASIVSSLSVSSLKSSSSCKNFFMF